MKKTIQILGIISIVFITFACDKSANNNGGLALNASSGTSGTFCTYTDATSASHCGCSVGLPVNLSTTVPKASIPVPANYQTGDAARFSPSLLAGMLSVWPFGVHAQNGHTEGHRGLDFSVIVSKGSNDPLIPVASPVDGVITSIDNSQDSSGGLAREYDMTDPAVHFTTIKADCGIVVKFIPLKLDAGFVAGTRVSKGQRLGVLPRVTTSPDPVHYSSHFGIDVSSTDMALTTVCPAVFLSDADVGTIKTLIANSGNDESAIRTVNISCDSGNTQSMTYPAENEVCNARLSPALRNQLASCIVSKASQIW